MFETIAIGDGKAANNAHLQELPDPVTKLTWDNCILLSPALAKEKGISSNDVLVLKTAKQTIELPAQIQPGMHKDAIAIAVGYGRTAAGAVGTGVGKNAYILSENGVYSGISVTSLEKTGKNTSWRLHNIIICCLLVLVIRIVQLFNLLPSKNIVKILLPVRLHLKFLKF